jgi:hypothetical protein
VPEITQVCVISEVSVFRDPASGYNNPTFVPISLERLRWADGEPTAQASGFATWSLCSSRFPPSRCIQVRGGR